MLKPAKLADRGYDRTTFLSSMFVQLFGAVLQAITSCAQVLNDLYLGPGNFFTSVPIKYLALFQMTNLLKKNTNLLGLILKLGYFKFEAKKYGLEK